MWLRHEALGRMAALAALAALAGTGSLLLWRGEDTTARWQRWMQWVLLPLLPLLLLLLLQKQACVTQCLVLKVMWQLVVVVVVVAQA